jgi:hypothetical protein
MRAILAAIRAYIIGKLAALVADDVIENGLTDADKALIDAEIAKTLEG